MINNWWHAHELEFVIQGSILGLLFLGCLIYVVVQTLRGK